MKYFFRQTVTRHKRANLLDTKTGRHYDEEMLIIDKNQVNRDPSLEKEYKEVTISLRKV